MSHMVTRSQMCNTAGNPPGGDDNLPLGGIEKGAAALSKTEHKGKQPKSSAPMPGEFQTPPSASRLERIMKDTLSEYGNMMSPLTPQRSEIKLTRITIDPEPDPREESPLAQVYTEGIMPSFRRPETPLDPQIALTMISDYLEGIQCQWIDYGRGPKEFHNHGAALARETNDKLTNRAKSSETEMPIKRKNGTWTYSIIYTDPTADPLPYTRWAETGKRRWGGISLLESMYRSGGNGPPGGGPPGRGPSGDDPDDNGDSDDEIKDEDELNAQPEVCPNVRPHAQPNIPLIHGRNIGGNVAGQPAGNVPQRNYVSLPMGPVGPEIKAMNPPKPGKYGGQDDLKKFDDWVSQLLKYYPSEWYNQEIESPDRRTLYWSFEDLICGLFKCFVHEASTQNTTDQYNWTRFDHEKGALTFYNDLRDCIYQMVQPPDDYSFKRKFIRGLPHSIIKTIFEACGISAEHLTIEEILNEVQQMETAQKVLNLLTKLSLNPGGKSSQFQGEHHQQNKKGREGPTMMRGDKPQYFRKVKVQDDQGGLNPQEEIKQPASNDEEPEGGNTPEENKDETSSEELSEGKGPLEYVEDKYEVNDDDEPVTHLGAMYGDASSSEDERVVRPIKMTVNGRALMAHYTKHPATNVIIGYNILPFNGTSIKKDGKGEAEPPSQDHGLIQNLRDQKEKHISLHIGNQDIELQT
ncbi:hypothetical protein OG21DRAFT_1522992 [Imleria badia]|nr:hypothetical protein OG21DRAFT_1522992 [Imleria badia]